MRLEVQEGGVFIYTNLSPTPKEQAERFLSRQTLNPFLPQSCAPSGAQKQFCPFFRPPSPSLSTSGSTFLSRATASPAAAMAEPHLGL